MSERVLVALGVALLGLVLICLSLWLRSGRPAFARRWMDPWTEDWTVERVVLLGLPSCGGLLLCAAVIGGTEGWGVLRLLAIGAALLLAVPTLYFLIPQLPLPGVLYPRWAREVRDSRDARMRAFLSGHR